jgi:hypothetical protein
MFNTNKWVECVNAAHKSIRDKDRPTGQAQAEIFLLYSHLLWALSQVELLPTDIFDRPELAAILSAVQQTKTETPK